MWKAPHQCCLVILVLYLPLPIVSLIVITQFSSSVILEAQFVEMGALKQIYHRYLNNFIKMGKLITLSCEILLIFLET